MKTQKCKMRQKHCSCIHRCNNKSSLKRGMHHNTADSLWNCLSQRLAQIGLMPHDVGGSGDRFFTSTLGNCRPTCRSSHGRDKSFT